MSKFGEQLTCSFAAFISRREFVTANTKQNLPEYDIINAVMPKQAGITGGDACLTTAIWESTQTKSKASTQNRRETENQSHEVALSS